MIEGETLLLFLVLLVGVTIILAILIKAALERIGIPSLVGYLLLGIAMGFLDEQVHFLTPPVKEVYAFLAELGIISLLFRVDLVMILLIVAVLGKVIGTGLPAILTTGRTSALLLSISMVPRAEIAMIIMERGRKLGDWAVSPQIFTSMIIVSGITCIVSPLVLRPLLEKENNN